MIWPVQLSNLSKEYVVLKWKQVHGAYGYDHKKNQDETF